jgi:hypothetical protein
MEVLHDINDTGGSCFGFVQEYDLVSMIGLITVTHGDSSSLGYHYYYHRHHHRHRHRHRHRHHHYQSISYDIK